MANNERTVDLIVRARDQYTKVLENLKKMQNDVAATSAAATKRMAIANKIALTETQASIRTLNDEYRKLTATQGASAIEMLRLATQKQKLSTKALELQGALGQVDMRTRAITTAQKSGFAAWSRSVALMQQETGFAKQAAAALDKLNISQQRVASGGIMAGAPGGYSGRASRQRGDSGGRKGEDQDVELYGLKPYQLVNLGYQVNDVFSGLAMGQSPIQIAAQQAGQFAQIWPQMMIGLIRSIPQIAAVTAVLLPFIDAIIRVRTEANSIKFFSDQLALMADGGRYSAESLAANAREMQKLGVSIEDARQISLAFIKDGIGGDQMLPLVELAKQLADVTGSTVPEAAEKLSAAFNGNVDDVRALDQELRFLTADQLTQIRAMEDAGDAAGALSMAQGILSDRLADTVEPASEWQQALDDLTYAWNELVTAVTNSGVIELGASALGVLAQSARGWAGIIKEATGEIKKSLKEPTDTDVIQRLSAERARLSQLIGQSERADQVMFGAGANDSSETLRLKALLEQVQTEYDAIIEKMRVRVETESEVVELTEITVSASEEEKKLQSDIDDILNDQITKMREEADLAALTAREQFIENALLEARNDALERANELGMDFLGLTAEQTRLLREQAGLTFDQGENVKLLDSGISSYVDRVVGAESGGVADVKNPLSSATGLGQFIESTWLDLFRRHFPERAASLGEEGILALRKDADFSRQLIEIYARENAAILQKAGVSVNEVALHLAHFLGPAGATSILKASPGTPVSELLGADQIAANPTILGAGKTAADVVAYGAKRAGVSGPELAARERLNELDSERLETENDYLEAYKQRIEGQQFELSAATMEARQAAVAKALRDEELEAQRAGLTLTKEQRAEIEKTAGALFDRQNVEVEVNRLLEQRSLLLESLEIAQAAGDSGKVTEIVGQINSTEDSLQIAINKAIEFWQAIGGPGAEEAILKLENLRAGVGNVIEDLQTRFLPSAESLNEQLAEVGSNAFSAMAEAIANGTNIAQAFFQTLLEGIGQFIIEIGKAIIQQALFNAIAGGSTGGGAGNFLTTAIGSLFHSGGVVGRGGGSGTRVVNPGVFAGAQRFHSGGVLGLGPNEVPIIGLKDEEMLTRDDPRHVLNGGASGSQVNVKNVNVFDPVDVLEAALNSEIGEQVMMNFVTRRSRQFSGVIGV